MTTVPPPRPPWWLSPTRRRTPSDGERGTARRPELLPLWAEVPREADDGTEDGRSTVRVALRVAVPEELLRVVDPETVTRASPRVDTARRPASSAQAAWPASASAPASTAASPPAPPRSPPKPSMRFNMTSLLLDRRPGGASRARALECSDGGAFPPIASASAAGDFAGRVPRPRAGAAGPPGAAAAGPPA